MLLVTSQNAPGMVAIAVPVLVLTQLLTAVEHPARALAAKTLKPVRTVVVAKAAWGCAEPSPQATG